MFGKRATLKEIIKSFLFVGYFIFLQLRANKDHFIFVGDTTNQPMKKMLQEGLEPPTLGLLDPCSTKLSYQSSTLPTLGIEPRTFT